MYAYYLPTYISLWVPHLGRGKERGGEVGRDREEIQRTHCTRGAAAPALSLVRVFDVIPNTHLPHSPLLGLSVQCAALKYMGARMHVSAHQAPRACARPLVHPYRASRLS